MVVARVEEVLEEGAGGASGDWRTAAGFSGFRDTLSVFISCIYGKRVRTRQPRGV